MGLILYLSLLLFYERFKTMKVSAAFRSRFESTATYISLSLLLLIGKLKPLIWKIWSMEFEPTAIAFKPSK